MTYIESANLMADSVFRNRIKVACLNYATYIFAEAVTTPAHSTRIKWSQQTANSPDQSAQQIQPLVVMDAQVQLDGAAITDAALQTVVESTINKIM
jgi:hypothetical protein